MVEEVVRIQDEHYIHSGSARLDDRTRVLKHGDTFAVFDRFGNVERFGAGEAGVYHQDTRFLSHFVMRLDGRRPALLSSSLREDNAMLAVDLSNPDLERNGVIEMPSGELHLFRSKVLLGAECHERVRLFNYGQLARRVPLSFELGADFVDIFEVRGTGRRRRGRALPVEVGRDTLVLGYEGLDGRMRRTHVRFDPPPTRLTAERAEYDLDLAARTGTVLRIAILCEVQAPGAHVGASAAALEHDAGRWYEEAVERVAADLARRRAEQPAITTGNAQFNDWLDQSLFDLHMMRTETPHGSYPYAGVPWFSTPFGRDGLLTARECLWFDPSLAAGVLSYLAATQADEEDAARDAEPGKILHEARAGEMAATGEVPFARYYGTIDATPLFVALAGAYHRRTGDTVLVRRLWPNVERALEWIERHGDLDRDGFVEYARRSAHGLVHQGWKDSTEPVFHVDGRLAEPPIALCEVQGYVYAAWRAAAELAAALGLAERVQEFEARAEHVRQRFEQAFWIEELGTYAIALDGERRACRVRSSNPGHCLFSGIASHERARRVAATLLDRASFSGWGVRTIAEGEARYNPMSYHNGSIWPHDNAICAAGLARYGLKREAARILHGLFDASLAFDLHRLPELFCGFPRRPGEDPTHYPVSCAPQAWASGAVLLLIEACLGLDVRGDLGRVVFDRPHLPDFLPELAIRNLRVGSAELDLHLVRHERDVGINVLRRDGDVMVEILK